EVARGGQPQTARDGVPGEPRDDGLAEPGEGGEQPERGALADRLRGGQALLAQPAEVGARAEGPVPGARQHDDPDLRVGLGALERVQQLVDHLVAERVARLGPVEGDPGDPVRGLVKDRFVHATDLPWPRDRTGTRRAAAPGHATAPWSDRTAVLQGAVIAMSARRVTALQPSAGMRRSRRSAIRARAAGAGARDPLEPLDDRGVGLA